MITRSWLFSFLLCLALPSLAQEPEQDASLYHAEGIIDFHADINIGVSGLVKVAEHIKVFAAGIKIRRGIFRNIPVYRSNKYGRDQRIDIEVLQVLKDSVPVPYQVEEKGRNINIRIGDPNIILDPGVYEYIIQYQSRGHIGFFDAYDELYWNVTGNEWELPIAKASATVFLPEHATVMQSACYTGVRGSTATGCQSGYNGQQQAQFSTDHQLEPGEGFTIATGFTAGIIRRPPPPGAWQQFWEWFDAYKEYLLGVLGLAILLPYLYRTWRKYGKDPQKPVVVARFEPPRGYSPALIRYLHNKGNDGKSFAAALVNMAVKKAIIIRKDDKDYYLERTKTDPAKLSQEEKELFNKLLNKKGSLRLDEGNRDKIRNAKNAFEGSITTQVNLKEYFLKNNRQMITGGLVTIAILAAYLLCIHGASLIMFLFVIPFVAIGATVFFSGLRSLKEQGCLGIFLVAFGAVFMIAPMLMFYGMMEDLPGVSTFFVLLVLVIYGVFVKIIKAPTADGAVLTAEIEGFVEYLTVAEEHRLNILTPPEHTPQLFERLLPYAIALDVENEWGRKFKDQLDTLNYAPDWYSGSTFSYYSLGDSFSKSLVSHVNTASSPPPSAGGSSSGGFSGSSGWSSGSSGGGSSGGGGGGGGGGGW
ncbi:MAG: DUF2207 domain-containing protein [Chitinophagaceae bacterium]|nr:DUF2207 domain-containing protein [Chitinophagaceae bacterium]